MAGSVNRAIIIGNVGKDPVIRSMQNGGKVANFSLATSESWTDKNSGERREKTEWHRISVMNDRIADVVERFVRKGSKVCIEGKLQTRKWADQSGTERYTTEIVVGRYDGSLQLLDRREQGDAPAAQPDARQPGGQHDGDNGRAANQRSEALQGMREGRHWDSGPADPYDADAIPF